MNYDEAMKNLNHWIYQAVRCGNKERKSVTALVEMACDIDHLIDHGCTRAEMREKIKARKLISEGALK